MDRFLAEQDVGQLHQNDFLSSLLESKCTLNTLCALHESANHKTAYGPYGASGGVEGVPDDWEPLRWAERLGHVADMCEELDPGKAAEYRAEADAIKWQVESGDAGGTCTRSQNQPTDDREGEAA